MGTTVNRFLSVALLSVVGYAGCDGAADKQNKVENAQTSANDKVTSATVEANQKIASAQAEGAKNVAEAQAGLAKMRDDYTQSVTSDLAEVDRKVTGLEALDATLTGRNKADLDSKLLQIRTARTTVSVDLVALDSTPAAGWDDAKTRLDKEMFDLKALVSGSRDDPGSKAPP
jgi:vacuolar-type H+-ATPase subunit H